MFFDTFLKGRFGEARGSIFDGFLIILEGFVEDFGRILGPFWEGKIIDFRTFFAIFSMQNLECKLEGQKIEKKRQQERSSPFHPLGLAVRAGLGGRIKDGGKA